MKQCKECKRWSLNNHSHEDFCDQCKQECREIAISMGYEVEPEKEEEDEEYYYF